MHYSISGHNKSPDTWTVEPWKWLIFASLRYPIEIRTDAENRLLEKQLTEKIDKKAN